MSRVMTFSTAFPKYHPKAGSPTCFVPQILNSLLPKDAIYSEFEYPFSQKYHTVRAGNRWKVGDTFSPRIWSGKPYQSKQIIIAPDIEIKKIWDIELVIIGGLKEFVLYNKTKTPIALSELAKNDGLSLEDFLAWFSKPFKGQVICWSNFINY